MTEKTVAQKLQVKAGDRVLVVGGTPEEQALLGELPAGAAAMSSARAPGEADAAGAAIAVTFVHSRDELLARYASELPSLSGARAVWFLYPKGGRADVNRDVIMREAGAFGWRANSNVSVDDGWSAVRVRPLADGEASVG
ncbi:hypothetical protein [Leifsonia sp. NPDC058248]|uniref:hypothetical protein n=1 Tax=Leifsonia sp. NPDC058248 TaxID=3346402 RepID=UPI0036DC1899